MFTRNLFFIPLAFFMFQSQLSAAEDMNVDPLSNITVSKDEIIKSLDTLQKDGKISKADADRAKKELGGMSDAQVSGIKDTAINMVRKDPDKTVDLIKGKKIDLKQVEKQAEDATPK